MAGITASSRRFPLWWAPASVLTLVVAGWGLLGGWSLRSSWPVWVLVLVVGLARSAARHNLSLSGVPLGRVLLWAVLGLVIVEEVISAGLRPANWNIMVDTGVFAFVIAIEMADRVPARLTGAFDRLIDRGVLVITPGARKEFTARSERLARKWTAVGAPAAAAFLLLAWIIVLRGLGWPVKTMLSAPYMLFECLCGWVAGERLSRMIAYGVSWRPFKRDGAQWRLMPGHPDGAGGFKPIGGFFFYQSIIAGIPAVYLAVWWWFIPLVPVYDNWRRPFLGLLFIAIVLEILTFVLPMRSIHVLMRAKKAELLAQADHISSRIESLQHDLCEQESAAERQQIKDSITDLTEAYKRIEHVSTWPIDSSIRRRFSLNNVALFLPFIGYAVGGTAVWQQISDTLHNLGK
jgi:hypothetical protein